MRSYDLSSVCVLFAPFSPSCATLEQLRFPHAFCCVGFSSVLAFMYDGSLDLTFPWKIALVFLNTVFLSEDIASDLHEVLLAVFVTLSDHLGV